MNEQEILENMIKIADELNFGLDSNAIKIAKLKSRMDDWRCCPCDKKNPDRFCGSELCISDVNRDSRCHCGCYFILNNTINNKSGLKKEKKERTKKRKKERFVD